MSKDTFRQLANAISVVIALTVNVLASVLPLNGQNTGEISDRFQVYFVPAGYVFAIWGLIYIGWIAFAIYQFLPAQKESPRLRRDSGYLFVFVWSFAGIAVKQAAEPLVANSAWVAAVIAIGLAVYSMFQRKRASA